MTRKDGTQTSQPRLADRYAAWVARRTPPAPGLALQPEPRSIGLYARGKQIVAGNVLLAGHLVADQPGRPLWDLPAPDSAFIAEAQAFAWLDDLAALATAQARRLAQDWTAGWIARYGRGRGPGWTPDLAGRRLMRWLHHAPFLLAQAETPAFRAALHAALSQHAAYLARRAGAARPGLPRFEALTSLVYAGLCLTGMEGQTAPALEALARNCAATIDGEGGLPSRNPEELLEILTLLVWSMRLLAEADQPIPPALSQTADRIAPCLRVLRHADGGLARFQGGGKGAEGRLDQALAASAMPRPPGHLAQAMGYVRLSGGRTSVLADAADPPGGAAAARAHASTGAFELTSGRRPLIVSCGEGRSFGAEWQLAGRATQSHSALCIEGFSSSRFGREAADGLLQDRAHVTARRTAAGDGALVVLAHDGWVATHGLTASRELHLSSDGRRLGGTDMLSAATPADRARLDALLARAGEDGIAFSLRFHLHPDADASLDMGGHAVSVQLRSGEIWVFRHTSAAVLALEPSAYLEKGWQKPRPARQIVLSGQARGPETRIGWTLAKAQDTPLAIRDLDRDEPVHP